MSPRRYIIIRDGYIKDDWYYGNKIELLVE